MSSVTESKSLWARKGVPYLLGSSEALWICDTCPCTRVYHYELDAIPMAQFWSVGTGTATDDYTGNCLYGGSYAYQLDRDRGFAIGGQHFNQVECFDPDKYSCEYECAYVNSLYSDFGPANELFIKSIPTKKYYIRAIGTNNSEYPITTLTPNSDNESSLSYSAYPSGNSYGSVGQCFYTVHWRKLRLRKTDETPNAAKGIKFVVSVKKIKRDIGYKKNPPETDVIGEPSSDTFELDLMFCTCGARDADECTCESTGGDGLPTPDSGYLNGMSCIKPVDCIEECIDDRYNGMPLTQPHVEWYDWAYSDRYENVAYRCDMEVTLRALKYIE